MTKGQIVPFDVALKREDKRLEERKRRENTARRKLLPLVVIVCETCCVTTDELLDSSNRHPTVVEARALVRWIGYSKLHVGPTYLAAALGQYRVCSSSIIGRLRKRYRDSSEFKSKVDTIEAMLDAYLKRLKNKADTIEAVLDAHLLKRQK